MVGSDDMWLDATAGVQSEVDSNLRAEAFEIYVAEAARCRLDDRSGDVCVTLRSGALIKGAALGARAVPRVEGMIVLAEAHRGTVLVAASAVMSMTGATGSMRDEGAPTRSLASVLRDSWGAGDTVRALGADGQWRSGRLAMVAADHVDLEGAGGVTTLAVPGVEVWELPGALPG